MELCGCLFHTLGLLCVKFRVHAMKIAPCRKKKVGTVFFGSPCIYRYICVNVRFCVDNFCTFPYPLTTRTSRLFSNQFRYFHLKDEMCMFVWFVCRWCVCLRCVFVCLCVCVCVCICLFVCVDI